MTPDGLEKAPQGLSRFRIIRSLGGRTYRARRLGRGDVVAVKVLGPGRRGVDRDHLQDCLSRVRDLDHPGLVRTLDVVEDSGYVVIVSEAVEGEPLGRVLHRNVRMRTEAVLGALDAMAAGLEAAAKVGLVHGALHPNEIMLAPGGPKLTSVGLEEPLPEQFEATEEGPDGARFSPYVYAAPERLGDGTADLAADVFSLGAMAFHMLTGHPPYTASSLSELKLARMEGALRWPRGAEERIPVDLILLVEEMCLPDPRRRLSSYRELRSKIGLLRGGARARPAPRELPRTATDIEIAPAASAPASPAAQDRGLAANLGERKGPIMALASVALFMLVVGLGLRQFLGGGTTETEAGPRAETAGRTANEPEGPERVEPRPPPEPSPLELARKRFKDIEGLLAENPENKRPLVDALKELAARPDVSPWDIRAKMLLDKLELKEGAEGRSAFNRIAAKARSYESELRFAETLAVWKAFPATLHGTTWHDKVKEELARLERVVPEKYAEIDSRAQTYLARAELDAATAEYARVIANFGIERWVAKAKAQIERIDLAEERLEARRAAAEQAAKMADLKSLAGKAITGAYADAGAFRYDSAVKRLDEALKAIKEKMPSTRSVIERYLEAIKSEQDLFKAVADRYESGQAEAGATIYSTGQSFAIRKLRTDGIVLVAEGGGGSMESRLEWSRLAPEQMHKIFHYGALEMSGPERMALAVFCFHRGLLTEETNELTVAAKLDPVRAGRVAELKSLLGELRTRLKRPSRRRRVEITTDE